jgi:hypothetical protein
VTRKLRPLSQRRKLPTGSETMPCIDGVGDCVRFPSRIPLSLYEKRIARGNHGIDRPFSLFLRENSRSANFKYETPF